MHMVARPCHHREAVPWQEVLMSVETWKFMAMCVITVNLKQVIWGRTVCGMLPVPVENQPVSRVHLVSPTSNFMLDIAVHDLRLLLRKILQVLEVE